MNAWNKRKRPKHTFKPAYNKYGIFELLYKKACYTFDYSAWGDYCQREYHKKRKLIIKNQSKKNNSMGIDDLFEFNKTFLKRMRKKWCKYHRKTLL